MTFLPALRSRLSKRMFAVLAGAMVVLGITAVPAFAHNPGITATVDCAGKVSFSSTAWASNNPLSRSNDNIQIQASVNYGAYDVVATGAYTTANSYTFSGSFTVPTTFKEIRVRSYAAGPWKDGHEGGSYSVNEVVLKPVGGCTTSAPKASIAHDCNGYDATLDNSGSNVAVDFVVKVNGETSTVTVPAGQVKHATGAVTEDSTYTITVTAGGDQLATDTFTVNCTSDDVVQPTATVSVACDGYSAVLDNSKSTVPVTFTVTVTGQAPATYEVAAGAVDSKDVAGDVPPDVAFSVSVAANGTPLASDAVKAGECSTSPPVVEPKAAVANDCTTYTASLDNRASDVPVEFSVSVNGVVSTVTVAAGDTGTKTGPVEEDGTYTVTVSANGEQLATSTFTVDCTVVSPPGPQTATLTHDCETYSVQLDNTEGTAPATFTVTVNGVASNVTVAAGDTGTKTGPVAEDATYTIAVSVDGDELVEPTTFTVNCTVVSPPTDATASITHDCDTWSVDLDNSAGTEAAQYTVVVRSVTDNGASADSSNLTVAAGDTDQTGGSVTEDTRYTIVVRVGDDRVARDTFTVNCTKVSPPSSGGGVESGSASSGTSTSALPDTGSTVSPGLLVGGIGLVSAGSLVLLLGFYRRRSATR